MSVFLTEGKHLNPTMARKARVDHPWRTGLELRTRLATPKAFGHASDDIGQTNHIPGSEGCYIQRPFSTY